MLYKFTLLTFGLITILSSLCSQDFSKINNKEEVSSILSESAKNITTLKGEFLQTKLISSLGIRVESKGNFMYKKQGSKILWRYSSPTAFAIVFKNGEFKIQQNKNVNASSIKQNAIFSELNTVIISSLNGNLANTNGFSKDFLASEKEYLVELVPVSGDLKQLLNKLEIYFNKSNNRVCEAKLFEVGGDVTSIEFINLQSNSNISDSVFNFE